MEFDLYNAGREEHIQYIKLCIVYFVLKFDYFTDYEKDSINELYNNIIN